MPMRNRNQKGSRILQLFEIDKCLTIEDLCSSLSYSSRSVQRLLKEVGYYSSFTHNGKWYTLQTIPEFDRNGLWFHQDIGFSKYRDLNATILYLIDNSANGLTAKDLSRLLSTSCPPVLNRIYKTNKIIRIKTPRGFVYISADPSIKNRQLDGLDKAKSLPRLSDADTITILVEFIRNPNRTPETLALYLKKKRGNFYSADTIKNLFVSLGLEKKISKRPRNFS
jgi:hypothetical protein